MLHALLMGIFITFVYDIIRIFRRVVPHNSFFVSLEDLGYWIYCGGAVFLLMYHESNGELRWFAVLGAVAGILLYSKTVSVIFVKYTSLVLSKALKAAGKALKWLLRPLGFLFRRAGNGAKRAGQGTGRFFRNIRRIIKYRLTYFVKMLKISLKK